MPPGAKGVPLFLELKERIREELKPDFLLIDSRTGITEMGGVATTILPEKVVCLLLANSENLDGARAVLRSLRRGPRLSDTEMPEIVPVLSRIPLQDEDEHEQKLVEEIRSFLNEKAENLEETLEIPELLVLHSEPDLQLSESLLVRGSRSPDESVLLRDYLRLFVRIIPAEILLPRVDVIVEQARSLAFDDPDFAQKTFESFSQLGHPHAYRELLKFYRLRKSPAETVLHAAKGLWEIAQDSDDPLLWDAVKTHFTEIYPETEHDIPWGSRKGDLSLLRFVESVWRAKGASDVKIGCDLAESFDNFGQGNHAADLFMVLVEKVGPDERAVVQCLKQLWRVNRLSEARSIIERFHKSLSESAEFLFLWAEFAIQQKDPGFAELLLEPRLLQRLSEERSMLTCRLLIMMGRIEDARDAANRVLQMTLRHGTSGELDEVGEIFLEMGRYEEFKEAVKETFPASKAERFLEHARRERRRYTP